MFLKSDILFFQLSASDSAFHFFYLQNRLFMAQLKISGTVNNGIMYIHSQSFCHRKIIVPHLQHMADIIPGFFWLFHKIMSNLADAHLVQNKLQVVWFKSFFYHPAYFFIPDCFSCTLFKLQPFKFFYPAIHISESSKLFLIYGQEFCWFSAFSFYCICCPVVQYILN